MRILLIASLFITPAFAQENIQNLELTKEFNFDTDIGISDWQTTRLWGNDTLINGEQQYYITPLQGQSPFQIEDGVLSITASQTPDRLADLARGRPFISGHLSSRDSFSQLHGYFEARIRLSSVEGIWPTFMLLPDPSQEYVEFYPELTVMETVHKAMMNSVYYASMHTDIGGKIDTDSSPVTTNQDLTDWHTYGVKWDQESIVWYFNGDEVKRVETPADWTQPRHLVLTLSVGGWAGDPDLSNFPASMYIDYVRAYSERSEPFTKTESEPVPEPVSEPVPVPVPVVQPEPAPVVIPVENRLPPSSPASLAQFLDEGDLIEFINWQQNKPIEMVCRPEFVQVLSELANTASLMEASGLDVFNGNIDYSKWLVEKYTCDETRIQ